MAGPMKAYSAMPSTSTQPLAKTQAFESFKNMEELGSIVDKIGRSKATVIEYLCEYINSTDREDYKIYITDEEVQKVSLASKKVGRDRLKPIYLELREEIPYDTIRIALAVISRNSE
jgi:hypothetical protein